MATDGQVVGGLRLWLFGFEFVLLAAHLAPGVPTMFDASSYRPGAFREVGTGSEIPFRWRNGPQGEEVEVWCSGKV
jgi:hypothetical protein